MRNVDQELGDFYGSRFYREVFLAPGRKVAAEVASKNLAARDASLGVGHIWTAVDCPAYRTLNPSDCTCGAPA